jgi:hypothetical protein
MEGSINWLGNDSDTCPVLSRLASSVAARSVHSRPSTSKSVQSTRALLVQALSPRHDRRTSTGGAGLERRRSHPASPQDTNDTQLAGHAWSEASSIRGGRCCIRVVRQAQPRVSSPATNMLGRFTSSRRSGPNSAPDPCPRLRCVDISEPGHRATRARRERARTQTQHDLACAGAQTHPSPGMAQPAPTVTSPYGSLGAWCLAKAIVSQPLAPHTHAGTTKPPPVAGGRGTAPKSKREGGTKLILEFEKKHTKRMATFSKRRSVLQTFFCTDDASNWYVDSISLISALNRLEICFRMRRASSSAARIRSS